MKYIYNNDTVVPHSGDASTDREKNSECQNNFFKFIIAIQIKLGRQD